MCSFPCKKGKIVALLFSFYETLYKFIFLFRNNPSQGRLLIQFNKKQIYSFIQLTKDCALKTYWGVVV
jgi:hypothetical protein